MAERTGDSFRALLLRHRRRTGLTQRQLADRLGVEPRTVHAWEAGSAYPSVERLQTLIAALLQAGGLSPVAEVEEAACTVGSGRARGAAHARGV